MSDVLAPTATFFDLWRSGKAAAGDFDDYLDRWHDGGHASEPSLAHYLGFTEDEYAIFVMALDPLPMIAAAREGKDTLENAARRQIAEAVDSGDPKLRGLVVSLSAWLADRAKSH